MRGKGGGGGRSLEASERPLGKRPSRGVCDDTAVNKFKLRGRSFA